MGINHAQQKNESLSARTIALRGERRWHDEMQHYAGMTACNVRWRDRMQR
jgi:hypothetical protein